MEHTRSLTSKILFWATILFWVSIFVITVDHVLAPRGVAVMRWPHPGRPSAHFHWTTNPATSSGWQPAVLLSPGKTEIFTVRLLRGFTAGQVKVEVGQSGGQVILSADTRADKKPAVVASGQKLVTLSTNWHDLAAQGKEFQFRLRYEGNEHQVPLYSITITAQR